MTRQVRAFKAGQQGLWLARSFADAMLETIPREAGFLAVVPIPLSPDRKVNRVRELAALVADGLGLPVVDLLALTSPCRHGSFRREKRSEASFEDAYRASLAVTDEGIPGQLLVVDDLCTTGATLGVVADELQARGARVSVAVFAMAVRSSTYQEPEPSAELPAETPSTSAVPGDRTSLDGRELGIVDGLIAAAYPLARSGDAAASDRVIRLMEMRMKLKDQQRRESGREAARQNQPRRSAD